MNTSNNTSSNQGFETFFETMLQEMYWSEQHQINVLETMSASAGTGSLQEAFDNHRNQSRTHVQRLQKVFDLLNIEAEPEPSIGLQGLFDEGWQVIDETPEGSAQRDAALIIAAQKVEHYEIACYGSLVTLARTMGKKEIADQLALTLQEEKETDLLLTGIAEGSINQEASQESAVPESSPAGNVSNSATDTEDADLEQQRKEALTERD